MHHLIIRPKNNEESIKIKKYNDDNGIKGFAKSQNLIRPWIVEFIKFERCPVVLDNLKKDLLENQGFIAQCDIY